MTRSGENDGSFVEGERRKYVSEVRVEHLIGLVGDSKEIGNGDQNEFLSSR